MVVYNFKKIRTVPTSTDFVDIVLSKTQRKTPTVVHPGYAIGRIRAFYMRKVKFSQEAFCEKLDWILEDFPKLDDIHPFYSDLCNVLYDRDHYKLALGQLNVCRNILKNVSRDYVRLLKYADSLYRCKQLKRSALGRMCTLIKKHKNSLAYLEEVRKHLSRLPSIDPNTRTLLVTGYPNVGKSSFMNKITKADVDVQSYAFTTKSLFVGHFDYKYLRYQVIDTPGILDKPLEERNTIEMQAITALAHLQCCVLYFFDLSEQCGFSLEKQISLFENISPLFANKPLVVVANKVDVMKLADLPAEQREKLENAVQKVPQLLNSGEKYKIIEMSSHSDVGITEVKRSACEQLISLRVQKKLNSKNVDSIINRITVVNPKARDEISRPVTIPESVRLARQNKLQEENKANMKTEKDLMWENGGPGVYSMDYRKLYDLDSEEKYDVIPEIMDGKNIMDFIDPDILEKLDELEKEEDEIMNEMESKMNLEDDAESELGDNERFLLSKIREQKTLIKQRHRSNKGKNRPNISKKDQMRRVTVNEFKTSLQKKGYQIENIKDENLVRGRNLAAANRKRKLESLMDVEQNGAAEVTNKGSIVKKIKLTKNQSAGSATKELGIQKPGQKEMVAKLKRRGLKKFEGMKGEADRSIGEKLPKHLYSGKRGMGKTQRR